MINLSKFLPFFIPNVYRAYSFFTNLDLFCIDNARVIYRKIRYLFFVYDYRSFLLDGRLLALWYTCWALSLNMWDWSAHTTEYPAFLSVYIAAYQYCYPRLNIRRCVMYPVDKVSLHKPTFRNISQNVSMFVYEEFILMFKKINIAFLTKRCARQLYILLHTNCTCYCIQTVHVTAYKLYMILHTNCICCCIQTVYVAAYKLYMLLQTNCTCYCI